MTVTNWTCRSADLVLLTLYLTGCASACDVTWPVPISHSSLSIQIDTLLTERTGSASLIVKTGVVPNRDHKKGRCY
jgi:hypothetical protein